MRRSVFVVLITFLGIGFTSCSKKISQQHQLSEFRLRGQLFWVEPSGIYKGAIPCVDCAGIEVTLDFNENNTVKKTMRYIKEGRKVERREGTWVVQAGNIVEISYPNKTLKEFYKAKSGGHLVALNVKLEEEKSEGGQFNIFNKDSMTKLSSHLQD